jgi:mannosyltransferase OCH1-like enzyme
MIPKIVHLTWKTKDILSSTSPLILNGIAKLKELNPDWKITIYTDDEIDNYLKYFLEPVDYDLIKDVHVVGKSDLWRLLKMYNEGGLYMDIDRLYNVSLSDIITSDTIKWVLPTFLEFDFSHDIMLSAPGNPVFMKAAQLHIERRREGNNNIYFLGAQTYMHAITFGLMGKMINTDPGKEVFEEIRAAITEADFIKTYRETSPLDTMVYRDDGTIKDHEYMKRALYKEYELKHWTEEW